ncbi:ferric reductase family protein ASCRUDRAFT_7646 [Ascoidea rubescens DSM 1968]|uniref:FAD-binding FR-type domain-containing protein n=1 Tax=Ascoidea rubescens DSM 1968 TaxID=1344418 RepID=A0A1D2VID5_9ASCO|nr:hypothetical protein ASCRUDRAFT_7646 [Ascoidea rubescens DSM 1968]ODV61412.1 hypothetical protein ASCRUDRAFT_7646 [Ascoidea rubescens DSM 1968]
MKISTILLLSLSSLIAKAAAGYSETYSDEYYWYSSCYQSISSQVLYCDAQKEGYGYYYADVDCSCTSVAAMGSMLYCLYNQDNDINKLEKYVIKTCAAQNVSYTNEELQAAYRNATHYLVDMTEVENYNVSEDYFYSPIYHDPKYVKRSFESYKVLYDNNYYSWLYGIGSVAYWAGVLALCSIFHWSKVLFPNFVARCTGPISRAWRATVVIPAALDRNHLGSKYLFGKFDIGLVPTRFESLVILGFYAIELAINVAHIYPISGGNTIRTTRALEIYDLIGIRSGVLAVWIFPLVMLFAGRNNFLISITGINQASFTRWWESHPFTIVESDGDEQNIIFYIKVKEGITLYIYNYLMKQPDHSANIRVTVEGPYGRQQPTRKYSKVLLIAGGNGIPGPYTHALDLVSHTLNKQIRLYWTIREWKNLEWFYDELAKLGHYKDKCEVYIYCTRGGDMPNFGSSGCSSEAGSISKTSKEKTIMPMNTQQKISNVEALSYIRFENGRPDLKHILGEEIETAAGSIAVMSCGHPKMCDELRSNVARMTLKSDKRIDYFEENQLW